MNEKSNVSEYTVSAISGALKRTVEDAFGYVRVRGEISGYRGPHSSGHAYFALKDERARLEAVIWRGVFSKLKFQPEEGLEVIVTGKLTTYPGSSKYQVVIENLEPAGAGALMMLLDERRRKLEAEGLFDAARKQLLPDLPRVIGVVTSPTGAVIRDIIHRITDRYKLHVLVWPVRVQGETSGAEVAAAVDGFNALDGSDPALPRPDVVIVARGGGSLEDLWGFNDEALVRAVANSDIPVISAVGHETDWTLVDHAADVRAPTPTAAAELAVPVRSALDASVETLGARLSGAIGRSYIRKTELLRAASRGIPTLDAIFSLPRRRFDEAASRHTRALSVGLGQFRAQLQSAARMLTPARLQAQTRLAAERLSRRSQTLTRNGEQMTVRPRQSLAQMERLLASLSHNSVLERGFALVRDDNGQMITSVKGAKAAKSLEIEFADGRMSPAPLSEQPEPPVRPLAKPKARGRNQGELF